MKKKIKILVLVVLMFLILLGVYWIFYLKKAHSTFDNYYKFRGCDELVVKTTDYGICTLKNGKDIKIVKSSNKWYLDGDLPSGKLFNF